MPKKPKTKKYTVREALELVHRGLKSGNIPDQTILLPYDKNATEIPMIALSKIVADALTN